MRWGGLSLLRTEGAEDDERQAALLLLGVGLPPDAQPDQQQDLVWCGAMTMGRRGVCASMGWSRRVEGE